ncbi:hypothetical protein BS78_02G061400 [Paspalum vaginatum]|nr:hypothetical protein BS78_02G061400 [Paspalum vaginatum]
MGRRRSALAGLPDDLLLDILSRLPVKDLYRSKCLSRDWNFLIVCHRDKLPQTLLGFFCGEDPKIRDNYIEYYPDDEEDSDEDDYAEDDDVWCRQHPEFGAFVNLTKYVVHVDHSFSFLRNVPHDIYNIRLLRSCNGYIVCNPATEQWVAVPSDWTPADPHDKVSHAYLVYDPAVSHHFHIVMFWDEDKGYRGLLTVHAYSSDSGVWSHSETDWSEEEKKGQLERWRRQIRRKPGLSEPSAIVNGALFLLLGQHRVLEVDVQGRTRRIILAPFRMGDGGGHCSVHFIGQSQGHLYCIRHASDAHGDGLSIWVLEDYDTQEWVLKHSVSWAHMFGNDILLADFEVVAIHPDCNMVFIFLSWGRKLISYDIKHKEVRGLYAFERGIKYYGPYKCFTPYVPCFLESAALTNKY